MSELANPPAEYAPPQELVEAFAHDPYDVLAQESRKLFDVYHDPDLDEIEKGQQLDGYFRLVESLDRATFPDKDGIVEYGVPQGYIPDGLIDMGSVSDLEPSERYGRPLNYVDTYATLHQHKEVIELILANMRPQDFSGARGEAAYQQTIIENVAQEIRRTMPYGDPVQAERGGILPVSTAMPALCQQHALTAQVLLQAFGIRSRLSKNYVATQQDMEQYGATYAGYDHVSNVVTMPVDGEDVTYMLDPTNPQLNQRGEVMRGLFRMEHQTTDGSWLVNERTGGQRKYKERNNMYWTVQRQY